jgi:cell wall assembly regulator SMI1
LNTLYNFFPKAVTFLAAGLEVEANWELQFPPGVRHVSIANCPITDEHVPPLMACHNLEVLEVQGTKLTSKGIAELVILRSLRALHVSAALAAPALAAAKAAGRSDLQIMAADAVRPDPVPAGGGARAAGGISKPGVTELRPKVTMREIEQALDLIKGNGWEVHVEGPARAKDIAKLEKSLGYTLPPTYRSFLERYGSLAIDDEIVLGIASDGEATIITGTESLREWQEVPAWIAIIMPHEDGGYAIDFSKRDASGECAIVSYEGSPDAEGRAADSFGDWLTRFVFDSYIKRKADDQGDEEGDEGDGDSGR